MKNGENVQVDVLERICKK
ncbi:hypothetical protein MOZ64_10635 [Absicoccus sp. CLA-KB-P134]|uniref:Uncharacterized protein n=1 Tax=Absicoccus intestinalis TaxID=2926319 RepID=A0ABU4WSD4_9FIRM|nr:hypothetical protein [Absicoccus sp. CLA-KB-P134]MDX8418289.1 hypothetical protein [Absicoccus sp. CLA-KB-P134]